MSGIPVKQIAERFGVHRTTITKIVTRAGAKVRSQPFTSSTRDDARRLYDIGRSLAQVAEQLGISASAVRSAVLVTGSTLRPTGGPRETAPTVTSACRYSRPTGPRDGNYCSSRGPPIRSVTCSL